MENTKEKKGLNISVKSFITAIAIIFGVMLVGYILTFIIPQGQYQRDEETNAVIDGSFALLGEKVNFSFFKWIASPILILFGEDKITIISILLFLLIIGGVFNCLNNCGVMRYLVDKITYKYESKKYLLMAILSFFFMAMGSMIGSFEEVVPLVPIIVALSIDLGWDALTGLGMSLLSVGAGFAAGVCNPFTVGLAQNIANLPVFSGIWLRLVSFILIYCLLYASLYIHAKRVDTKKDGLKLNKTEFQKNANLEKGALLFGIILGIGIVCVFLSAFISALQSITMIIVAVMFLIAGVVSCFASKMQGKEFWKGFLDGVISMLPSVVMVLMASSVKYILTQSYIMDTILYYVTGVAKSLDKVFIILFIYLFVLIMNFLIASGSAKVLLLMPLIISVASSVGISPQLCVVAFAFGDGFSNVFYPTNPVLLISLGVTNTEYGKWVKYSWKFQLLNLVLTSALLILGLYIGY